MAKIAIIINSLFSIGGEERVVALMANEFAKEHDVTIFTSETRRNEKGKKNSYYLSDDIKVCVVDSKQDSFIDQCIKTIYRRVGWIRFRPFQMILQNVFYPKQYLDSWRERINKGDFDIVIPITGSNTMMIGLIRDKISTKCISWEHSSYEGYFAKKTGAFKSREKLFSDCAKKMDAVIVLNDDIRKKYSTMLDVEPIVISNPKSFSSVEKADYKNKTIVSCGRLESEKAFDDLLLAFESFHKVRPEWKLKIVGGGRLEKELSNQIIDLGLKDSATITGYTDNVKEELLSASMFVMTSRWEGFPMTITEALELGLPVVAYGIPALGPLVRDGIEGYIVPPFDRKKLVDAMINLADNEENRKEMSLSAIEKASMLTPGIIYKRWSDVFERICSNEQSQN